MKQYNAIKGKHPDALLLFRVGDFYETFGSDAITAANILGIVLTKRKNGAAASIELAGFPHHSLDTYLPKLVRAGQRVAICDQLEDPKQTKTIVKRGVTELVTPGVSFNDEVLDQRSNNFLAAVHLEKKAVGVAFLDVSTGEFLTAQGNLEYVDKLLQSFRPSEVLYQRSREKAVEEAFGDRFYRYALEDWAFTKEFSEELLTKQFGTSSLKGFGVAELPLGIIAAGVTLHYLAETQHDQRQHIATLSRIEEEHYVWLDRFTIRNLELFHSPNPGAVTLLDIIDHTKSPMGSRLLKRWLALPLKDVAAIEARLNVVEYATENRDLADGLHQHIEQVGDLERLISKAAVGRVTPREVVQLQRSLELLEPIKALCAETGQAELVAIAEGLDLCPKMRDRISREINPEAPVQLIKGNVMQSGVSEELDELRSLAYSGKDHLLQIQQRESDRTGIPSLKIGFNNVFGYYLEVTNAHKEKVPEEWIRKQTLVNAERYITEELKEYESKILGAEERIRELEARLFQDLVLSLADFIVPVQRNAGLLAKLDCLLAFAHIAEKHRYTKPFINEAHSLEIEAGRHPVIEHQLPLGEEYVTNDVSLDDQGQQVIMITGPNMSGKSALLRQTALIVLMAQMGSFVPAKAARIGLVDKIFTRVGASDNISLGESTFMVEMNETASILNNISPRSLILLDEIGRGTSTYDGISIAWAIAEYIHNHPSRAKTLFATHYHELNEMTHTFERIRNYNVAVKEVGNRVIFLRKLVPGGSEHSFGIHVARMAGMPRQVVEKSKVILRQLEQSHANTDHSKTLKDLAQQESYQLSFFQLDDPTLTQIKDQLVNIDIDTLTPVEALLKLHEIKKMIGK